MVTYTRITGTFVIALIALLGIAGTAFAQANVSAQVDVDAEVKPLRPVQILKEQREKIHSVKDVMQERRLNAAGNATNSPEERMRVQEARDRAQELRGSLRDRLHALTQTHLGNIVHRLNAALERFNNLIARIESRIEKLQEREIDTESVEASLEISVRLVAGAEADIQALERLIESVSDSDDAESVRAEIRAAVRKAIESIKAAHRGLLSTAKMLVALVRTSPGVDISTATDAEINVE